MKFTETTVAQEIHYQGIIVKVRRDKARLVNGVIADREVVEHPGGVAVFAIDEQEQVLMVRQFRYPMGEEILELPAGKLEPGEDPQYSALRELQEETGVIPGSVRSMGCTYSSPGIFSEKIHLFLAQDLKEGIAQPDEDEFLDVVRIPLSKLLSMIADDQIVDAKTIVGTMKALLLLRGEVTM